VKKRGLAPYLLLSFFIHAGLLMGMYTFLGLPAEVEPVDLIAVETVVHREEPLPPLSSPTISEQIVTTKALETKSQISTHIETDRIIGDMSVPVPKEGNLEPSLNIDNIPTLGVIHVAREGEKASSKPMAATFKRPPLRLSLVEPSPPDESSPLEVEMPKGLIEAEPGGPQAYSQILKKIEVPLGRGRRHAVFVSKPMPISTIEPPSIPEQRQMTLAVSSDLPLGRVARSEAKRGLQSIVQPDLRMALKKELAGNPKLMVPNNTPTVLNVNTLSSFQFPGSAKGAAYLFVVDTSGSIKGTPLEGIKKSAREFVRLMGRNDRAGIMSFNNNSELVSSFTSEKKTLRQKINTLRTAGTQTVLYDALMEASNVITKGDREDRFVVLFSDGKDEGSHSTLDDVIRETRQSDVSILSVGYSRVEKEYLNILRKLAGETGGDFVYAPHFHDILTLYRASRDISPDESEDETASLAFLYIKSGPIGAQVFVDGGFKGKTPVDLELPPGRHEIVLTFPNYHNWEAQIELSEDGETPLLVRLLPVDEKNE
jgi:hypothetical protein